MKPDLVAPGGNQPLHSKMEQPMSSDERQQSVLFVDVVDSTRLYSELGDAKAKDIVDKVLEDMRRVTLAYEGRVVKSIGDELMCVFNAPSDCAMAAIEMQEKTVRQSAGRTTQALVRVGFHYGPVIYDLEGKDVFGATVNIAARVVEMTRPSQIMTTSHTADLLQDDLRSAVRQIAKVAVKGEADVVICELIWQQADDLTRNVSDTVRRNKISPSSWNGMLRLNYVDRTQTVHEQIVSIRYPIIKLGRGATNDLVVDDDKASRFHASVERRRDKFYLIDQSTNGTFVSMGNQPEIALYREEIMLLGKGFILLGHGVVESIQNKILFELVS